MPSGRGLIEGNSPHPTRAANLICRGDTREWEHRDATIPRRGIQWVAVGKTHGGARVTISEPTAKGSNKKTGNKRMSTYTQICYHIVFSTKNRDPVLVVGGRPPLFRYIWGIVERSRSRLYRITAPSTTCTFSPVCIQVAPWPIS